MNTAPTPEPQRLTTTPPASTVTPAAQGTGHISQIPPISAAADHLVKRYGTGPSEVTALNDVSLEVGRGEFVAIMGPSGSGKSTLMHLMAGLDTPSSGRARIGIADLTVLNDLQLTKLRRDRVGFVFQSFNLLPTLNVRENVLLPFLLAGRTPTTVQAAWADELITRLGLDRRVTHRPSELSGGQQQRVAIARALVTRPVVLFADEPTGNLDSRSSREVLDLLQHMAQHEQQSIVMVTHDAIAASRADRVVILADGAIVRTLEHSSAAEISRIMLALEADSVQEHTSLSSSVIASATTWPQPAGAAR